MKPIYLREQRQRMGLTQEELAAKSGISQAAISKLELEDLTHVKFDTVVKLADALGVDARQLRFGRRVAVAS